MHSYRMLTRSTLFWLVSAGAVALTAATPAYALGPWEDGTDQLQNPDLYSGCLLYTSDAADE